MIYAKIYVSSKWKKNFDKKKENMNDFDRQKKNIKEKRRKEKIFEQKKSRFLFNLSN